MRGGLAARQQRIVAAYIDDHLAERTSLSTLARLADLSPYHFARAFKQSFGLPPYRYLVARRVERAELLLADHALSVTEVALSVGFSETSSFSAAFHRVAGVAPSAYRRGVA